MKNILLFALLFSATPTLAADLGPTHWNADLKAPQRFYATQMIFRDPPMTQDSKGRVVEYASLYAESLHSTTGGSAAPEGLPFVRPATRVVSAPVRWFFHFRPLRRLFGRC